MIVQVMHTLITIYFLLNQFYRYLLKECGLTVVYNHWTGLVDWTGGLDCMVDWTSGLTFFVLKMTIVLSTET